MVERPRAAGEQAPQELRDYLAVLWTRKWWVVLTTVAVLVVAMAYSFAQTPIYVSEAVVLVRPVNLDPAQPPSAGGYVQMPTEQEVATSAAVGERAVRVLGGRIAPSTRLAVQANQDTQTMLVQGSSPDPEAARATAQAYAEAYLAFRRDEVLSDLRSAAEPIQDRIDDINADLEEVQRDLLAAKEESERLALQIQFNSLLSQRTSLEERQNEIIQPQNLRVGEILQDAEFPAEPSTPDHPKTAAFAMFVGLSLGVGLAFLRDRTDQRLRDRVDLELRAGVPVLAVVPPAPRRRGPRTVATLSDPMSPVAEVYKKLRTSILFAAARQRIKTIMITSAHPEEGKTTTLVNLGAALAQSGKQVILVAGDLRRPKVHTYLAVGPEEGLTDVLSGERHPLDCLITIESVPNLRLLGSGALPSNPADMLGSEAMRGLLVALGKDADLVLVDATPVLGVSDAVALAPLVDATLLVADAERTGRRAVEEVRHELEQVGGRLIGAVLTNYEPARLDRYYYYEQDGHEAGNGLGAVARSGLTRKSRGAFVSLGGRQQGRRRYRR